MKNKRYGKAAIFNSRDVEKIRKSFTVPHHRCIFEIALYTGERMGAIVQLKVSDVYADPIKRTTHPVITFASNTRKKRPDGSTQTRQVPIHPDLKDFLMVYNTPQEGYLFPSDKFCDRFAPLHITRQAVDKYWRRQFYKLNLDRRGFSTHSTRRWLITQLAHNGIDIKTIQQITGHKSVSVLLGYIEADEMTICNALGTIKT
jgi:integrase/recombinase XerD